MTSPLDHELLAHQSALIRALAAYRRAGAPDGYPNALAWAREHALDLARAFDEAEAELGDLLDDYDFEKGLDQVEGVEVEADADSTLKQDATTGDKQRTLRSWARTQIDPRVVERAFERFDDPEVLRGACLGCLFPDAAFCDRALEEGPHLYSLASSRHLSREVHDHLVGRAVDRLAADEKAVCDDAAMALVELGHKGVIDREHIHRLVERELAATEPTRGRAVLADELKGELRVEDLVRLTRGLEDNRDFAEEILERKDADLDAYREAVLHCTDFHFRKKVRRKAPEALGDPEVRRALAESQSAKIVRQLLPFATGDELVELWGRLGWTSWDGAEAVLKYGTADLETLGDPDRIPLSDAVAAGFRSFENASRYQINQLFRTLKKADDEVLALVDADALMPALRHDEGEVRQQALALTARMGGSPGREAGDRERAARGSGRSR